MVRLITKKHRANFLYIDHLRVFPEGLYFDGPIIWHVGSMLKILITLTYWIAIYRCPFSNQIWCVKIVKFTNKVNFPAAQIFILSEFFCYTLRIESSGLSNLHRSNFKEMFLEIVFLYFLRTYTMIWNLKLL